jgi:hypothetical protein
MKTFTKDGEIKVVNPRAIETIQTLLAEGWVEVELGA